MPDARAIPVVVLGGSGYVAGELLRLLESHPRFSVAAVASSSQAGEEIGGVFPNLATAKTGEARFCTVGELEGKLTSGGELGIFAATPHGATAALLDGLLHRAEQAGATARAVDLSADFRFADPARFESIYGIAHGAPRRCADFVCGVPELVRATPRHAAQPGCFTTAVVLAAFPLLTRDLVEDEIFVSAVTGSSGAGRTPTPSTHHPERRSNLFAYSPLSHRHEPEMRALLAPAREGREPEIEFVPHSGPFVRGIHATLRLTLKRPIATEMVARELNDFYSGSPFVSASTATARLVDVVGSNRCRLGVATRGSTLVVTSVLDNLIKGAAGGAIQWMNRLFGLPDDAGLTMSGPGWF